MVWARKAGSVSRLSISAVKGPIAGWSSAVASFLGSSVESSPPPEPTIPVAPVAPVAPDLPVPPVAPPCSAPSGITLESAGGTLAM